MAQTIEDRYFDIATGVVEAHELTMDEREEFISLFAQPDTVDVDILARLHQRAGNELSILQEEIKALKEAENTLKTLQKNAEEGMLRYCLNDINTKITKSFTFKVKESKSTEIIDETLIPETYLKKKEVVDVDKTLILNDLKQDKEIPGAQLKVNHKVSYTENGGY